MSGIGRGEDDQIQILRLAACGLQGAAGGFQRQIAARHLGIGEMARMNARTLDDPGIGGFNAALRQLVCKVLVGDAARRRWLPVPVIRE